MFDFRWILNLIVQTNPTLNTIPNPQPCPEPLKVLEILQILFKPF